MKNHARLASLLAPLVLAAACSGGDPLPTDAATPDPAAGGSSGPGGSGGGAVSTGGTGGRPASTGGAGGTTSGAGGTATPTRDGSMPPPTPTRDGGAGVACGATTCGPGMVCCNASCGICTPPGGACIQIACEPRRDAGTATDALGACRTDGDCRLFDDYCTGCDCRALARTDPDPRCPGPGVRCFAQPCLNKVAVCETGRCVARDRAAAATTWYLTCGDPVCRGWVAKPDVPRCSTEKAGAACPTAGTRCDPMDGCNRLLQCASSDPTASGCPRSRLATKRDVRYLSTDELARYRDELLSLKLATWRYQHAPARERLGFIIDDHETSVAVDPSGEIVDLYGYTSLAIATLKLQAREIEALRAEVQALRRAQARPRRQPRAR